MPPKRRSSRRSAAAPVNYAEVPTALSHDDGDETLVDEHLKEAHEEQIKKELAAERAAREKLEEEDDDFGGNSKKKKKSKTGKKAKAKNAGKLSNIFSLPMDLLTIIFTEVEPVDLLHLSRANKQLNQFLSSRDAIPIWSASRRNLRVYTSAARRHYYASDDDDDDDDDERETFVMPDRPDNLTETAYARLLFENECSDCENYATWTDYALGMKLCKECKQDSLVNKQTALGALKGSQRKAVIEKVVFDLVPLPDKKGYYYLPAVFTLHDEIKEKKRTLKKEGEYDAWIDAKKKERKEQATSAKERADATWVWLRKYKQFGKVKRDEIRDALNREQTAFTDKRRNAIRKHAANEAWFDQTIWEEYTASIGGKRLINKKIEFTEAEWDKIETSLEANFKSRQEFAAALAVWDSKQPIRTWLGDMGRSYIPSAVPEISRKRFSFVGEVHQLPAAQPFFDLVAPSREDYPDYVDWVLVQDDFDKNRDRAFKKALPDITVQLRDRQIAILSDLVDKLAEQGTIETTSAQILATIADTEPPTNDEDVEEAAGSGSDGEGDDHAVKAEDVDHSMSSGEEPAGKTAATTSGSIETSKERMQKLKASSNPQVQALRALYAAITGFRAVFLCRKCNSSSYHEPKLLPVDALLKHSHFLEVPYQRNYDERITDYIEYAMKHEPSKWQSDHVIHPRAVGIAFDILQACHNKHNEEITSEADQTETRGQTAAAAEATNDATETAVAITTSATTTINQTSAAPPAQPAKATPIGVVADPQTRADVTAFDAKYRYICAGPGYCGPHHEYDLKYDQHTGKYCRGWEDMLLHVIRHVNGQELAEDAELLDEIDVHIVKVPRKMATQHTNTWTHHYVSPKYTTNY